MRTIFSSAANSTVLREQEKELPKGGRVSNQERIARLEQAIEALAYDQRIRNTEDALAWLFPLKKRKKQ